MTFDGIATPEELVSTFAPLLRLELVCNACGKKQTQSFEWACVNPDLGDQPGANDDGVLLSRIVECGCGAVDDYSIGGRSYAQLMRELLARGDRSERGDSRVFVARSQLFDGTVVRRPSAALAHLRSVAERTNSAEAYRRYGNACERWHRPEDALAAWRRAAELDRSELEARYSLAKHELFDGGDPQSGFRFLRECVELLPTAAPRGSNELFRFAGAVLHLLREFVAAYDDPVALSAAWCAGAHGNGAVVHGSSVDLRKVLDWDRLVELIATRELVALGLTPQLPTGGPTRLEIELGPYGGGGDENEDEALQALEALLESKPPYVAEARVGRNAPCPCGSGKKFKRCCDR